MKFLTTGLAVAMISVPVFAQTATERQKLMTEGYGRSVSPVPGGAPHSINPIQAAANASVAKSSALLNQSSAVGNIAKQGVYGPQTTSTYGYGYPVPVPVYPGYGYPAYGYPAPYPYPYPAYGYPSNNIVGAPLTQPYFSWERPAYATSIPLGSTSYYNNCPPGYYPPSGYYPPYGYGSYTQSTGASLSFGTGNVRVKVGSSRTINR